MHRASIGGSNLGIAFTALDNGVRACADPQRLQSILDGLDEKRIEALVRKWLVRLPHPFTAADRAAGYRYELSILQAEFARTQVLDRPLSGRRLFEAIIGENINLGRPSRVGRNPVNGYKSVIACQSCLLTSESLLRHL